MSGVRSPGRKPFFADYVVVYFEKAKVQRKRPGTLENERQAIERWRDYLGHVRIDQIATPAITAYLDKRLKGGIFCGRKLQPVSERTANLDLIMLRNVLKAAMDDGDLRELPRMKMLDEAPPPKRDLVTPDILAGLGLRFLTAKFVHGEHFILLRDRPGLDFPSLPLA